MCTCIRELIEIHDSMLAGPDYALLATRKPVSVIDIFFHAPAVYMIYFGAYFSKNNSRIPNLLLTHTIYITVCEFSPASVQSALVYTSAEFPFQSIAPII